MTDERAPDLIYSADPDIGLYGSGQNFTQTLYFHDGASKPIVSFHNDGTVEVHGDSYEAAKAFWDYVKQFAAAEYEKHAKRN